MILIYILLFGIGVGCFFFAALWQINEPEKDGPEKLMTIGCCSFVLNLIIAIIDKLT